MKEVLEAVDKLAGKIEGKAAESASELAKAKADFETKAAEANQKITDLTAKVLEMGGNLEDAQNEVKSLKAAKNALSAKAERKGLVATVAEAIVENKDAIVKLEKGGHLSAIELKVVGDMTSANLTGTGNNYVSYLGWQDGMEPIGQDRFRGLVRTIPSETDFVRYPRANSPIGEGSFGRQAAEGDTKAQVDRDYTMIDLTLKPMAGYATVSRQSLRNIVFLQGWLPTSMMEQLMDQEDTDFSNTLYFAATGSTTVAVSTNIIDKLVGYIANLKKGKYQPNGIAIGVGAWTEVVLTTTTGGGYNLPQVVTISAEGIVRILGVPVYPVNWLTDDQVIVGDWRKAAIVQSEGLTMRSSDSHASQFTSNEITFLLERTEGLAIFRPDAFIATNV